MKQMVTVSKRVLAVLLAVLMLSSVAAVTAFAEDKDLDVTLTPDCEAKTVTLKINTAMPENAGAVTYSVTPESKGVSYDKNGVFKFTAEAAGAYTFKAAFTAGEDNYSKSVSLTFAKASLSLKKNDTDKSIEVTSVTPSDATIALPNVTCARSGNLFYNLETGKTYTFVAYKVDASTVYYGEETAKLLTIPKAPENIKARATSATTIEIEEIAGAEYRIEGPGFVSDETANPWVITRKFENLTEGADYTVYARIKAVEGKSAASAPVSMIVKTLKNNTEEPAAVVIEKVTKTQIVVKEVAGYEYSIDSGAKYQSSNVFNGLKSGESYYVVQRIAENGETSASKASAAKKVSTNTADAYEAKITNVKDITWADGEFVVNAERKFTAHGDSRPDNNIQWGDTRLIPVNLWEGDINKGKVYPIGEDGKGTYKPSAKGDKVKLTVEYELKMFKGEYDEKGKAKWEKVENVTPTKTYTVQVNQFSSSDWRVQFFNFLLNQLPGYITQFIETLRKLGVSILLLF